MDSLKTSMMRNLANKVVNQSLRIGKRPDGNFESVRIICNPTDPTCYKFAQIVEEECWKVGAYTTLVYQSDERTRLRYQLTPEESLSKINPMTKAIVETIDVNIFIGEHDNPSWSIDVKDKMKIDAPNIQKLREILDNRRVRWLYFGWPLPGTAKSFGIPLRRFRNIFFNSIMESFSEKMIKLCRYYYEAFLGHDIVEIKATDGTDLSFSIKGRRILVDDGIVSDEDILNGDVGLNIPSGEVFIAPIEDTANGKIFFDDVTITGFGRAKSLWLTFENGKVSGYKAEKGEENFAKFLDANTGEKDRIAELGIGCNPGAQYTYGSIIVDEKIYRTIHIAIGNNTGSYHGKNKASSHLDMVKFMGNGQLYVDGRLVMDKGEPCLKL
ncbi:MAG: aminopeptidase [Nitrososphaeria archaeon]